MLQFFGVLKGPFYQDFFGKFKGWGWGLRWGFTIKEYFFYIFSLFKAIKHQRIKVIVGQKDVSFLVCNQQTDCLDKQLKGLFS